MQSPPRFARIVLSIFLSVLAVYPISIASAQAGLPAEFMPSSEIAVGMTAEGRTVFQGFQVESFELEILGVQHNAMAGSHMIIARAKEHPLLQQHGIVAGMSGSPVFIDGRLIGAIAYGWSFSYAPYCGITPIENMWEVWQSIGQPGLRHRDARATRNQPEGQAWDWQPEWQDFIGRLEGNSEPQPAASPRGFRPDLPEFAGLKGEMLPLSAPVYTSARSPLARGYLSRFLAGRGLELSPLAAVAGGAGGASLEPGPDFENGSSLGVAFVTGDLQVSSIGTMTYVHDGKFIGFGHPMFQEGGINAPLSQAYIFGFLQSYERSFKLSELRDLRGTISQDRLYAVAGTLGEVPNFVPMQLTIKGSASMRPTTYHYNLWDEDDYLPSLVSMCALEAYSASVDTAGRITADMDYSINLSNGHSIRHRFPVSGIGSIITVPVRSMLNDLFLLLENPYRPADIQSIDVAVEVNPGLNKDQLLEVILPYAEYMPGETVQMTGRFERWRGGEYQRSLAFTLPDQLDPGLYVIHVADSSGALSILDRNRPSRLRVVSFDDVLEVARTGHMSEDQLHVFLMEPQLGIDINGRHIGKLPASVQPVIENSARGEQLSPTVGRMVRHEQVAFTNMVSGGFTTVIGVADYVAR